MAVYTSKVEVLLKINELREKGEVVEAMRLQRVFIDSIKNDRTSGKFSSKIELDRKSKKVISGVGITLTSR